MWLRWGLKELSICIHSFQIFFYSGGIFERAKIAAHNIQYAVLGANAVNVVMTVVAVSFSCPFVVALSM